MWLCVCVGSVESVTNRVCSRSCVRANTVLARSGCGGVPELKKGRGWDVVSKDVLQSRCLHM